MLDAISRVEMLMVKVNDPPISNTNSNFKTHNKDEYLQHFLWNFPQMNAMRLQILELKLKDLLHSKYTYH